MAEGKKKSSSKKASSGRSSKRESTKKTSAKQAAKDAQVGKAATLGDGRGTPPVDSNDDVSPTGPANIAGTPQNRLTQAPPMRDESGSNIPWGNLRQPIAEGATLEGGAVQTTKESLDPALVDPEGAAQERVSGRTSDAANRSADGPQAGDVPPDITEGPKASDGGPEEYPFPAQGDVEVATVDPGTGEGEYFPNLEVDDWVILDGSHELVPDRLDGRRAVVLDAPRYLVPWDQKDDVWIQCRTRDDVNATLHIPLAAVKEVQKGGLAVTHRG